MSAEVNLSQFKPHAQVQTALLAGMQALQGKYPEVAFCVPDTEEIFAGRPAAWAFVRHGALARESLEALSLAMLEL